MPTTALVKVSILIPTFNQAALVGRAIESALAQTYAPLEVIVADDASSDETAGAVAAYAHDARVRYVRNATNLGRVANYRRALYEHATGEWVLNLDGDDYLLDPEFLAATVERLSAHSGAVVAIGGIRFKDLDGVQRDRVPTEQPWETLEGMEFFLRWERPTDTVPHLGALYHRPTAMAVGFYAHDILSSDWESLRRLVLRGRVLLTNRIAGAWNEHAVNASKALDAQVHLDNLESIEHPFAEALRLQPDQRSALLRWRRRALVAYAHFYVSQAVEAGRFGEAKRFLTALRRREPATFYLALGRLSRSPKFAARLALALGGQRLTERVRQSWRRVKYRRGG